VVLPRQGLRWLFGDARPQRMADGSVLWHGFTTDITGRKQMEVALRASERRLKAAERMARLGHFEIDSGTVVLSDGAYRLLGLDPETGPWSVEVFRPLIHKDDVDRVYAGYAQILKDGKSRDFIHRMIIEGEIRYFRNWVQAGTDDMGRVVRLFGTIQDITEQVRIERELRFKTDALENSLNGFEIISAEGKILYANRASLKMWGYASLNEIVGTSPLSHCIDPGLPDHMIETLSAQGEYLLEFQARRKDGYIFQTMVATRRFLDEDGRELFMRTSIDITDRKCAEIALRESQERFRFWMAATGSFFWMAAPDGTAIDRQPPLETSTGQPWEWLDAVHPEDRERVRACYQQAVREHKMYECEVRYWHAASGQYRWYLDRSIPRIGPRGEVTGWIGASVDIQKQKEAEFALQAADRRKDEFLAMLGHELRNPLAPIRNAAQILNSKDVVQRDPSLKWACGMIDRQVIHLVRLVDDLLDVSRLVQGKIVLKEEWVNLVEVVGHAVELGRSLVQGRHQHLSLYLPNEPLCIYGDKVRLTQVVENLLTNAAKYTPEGGQIRLDMYHQDGEAVIRIRDTGLGIAADLLPYIFDLFTQAHRDLDRRQGGLGIGLTVAKGLVQLHKGRIEVRSDGLGKGSEFTVYLPLNREAASGFCASTVMKVAEPPPMALVARRLLIVDDNADALESLAVLLELEGHTVKTALDGPAALTVVSHFQPDIILLDIGLPGMDGYEVAHRLRALDATRDTLLVAVTGYGQEGDRLRAKAAGFDHHFVKPIDVDALQRLLLDLGGAGESTL
jgi:PAS domain S-box-containing protein